MREPLDQQADLSSPAAPLGRPAIGLSHPRLDRELGDNELRTYLAQKAETGLGRAGPLGEPSWVTVARPLPARPRILLVAPPISVPRHMQRRCIPPLGLSYLAASLEQAGFSVEGQSDCFLMIGFKRRDWLDRRCLLSPPLRVRCNDALSTRLRASLDSQSASLKKLKDALERVFWAGIRTRSKYAKTPEDASKTRKKFVGRGFDYSSQQ